MRIPHSNLFIRSGQIRRQRRGAEHFFLFIAGRMHHTIRKQRSRTWSRPAIHKEEELLLLLAECDFKNPNLITKTMKRRRREISLFCAAGLFQLWHDLGVRFRLFRGVGRHLLRNFLSTRQEKMSRAGTNCAAAAAVQGKCRSTFAPYTTGHPSWPVEQKHDQTCPTAVTEHWFLFAPTRREIFFFLRRLPPQTTNVSSSFSTEFFLKWENGQKKQKKLTDNDDVTESVAAADSRAIPSVVLELFLTLGQT